MEIQPTAGPVKFAWRAANAWAYLTAAEKPLGPASAVAGMHSFLTVTRDNLVRLCYQQLTMTWQFVQEILAPCDALEEMLTHASFAPYKGMSGILAEILCDLTYDREFYASCHA